MMYDTIRKEAAAAMQALVEHAGLHAGEIVVVGCSSSEVGGHKIGTDSSPEVARAILEGILPILGRNGLYLAPSAVSIWAARSSLNMTPLCAMALQRSTSFRSPRQAAPSPPPLMLRSIIR